MKVKKEFEIDHKYLSYALAMEAPKYVNAGMGNPKLMNNVMEKIVVSLPSYKKQIDVVLKLNNLEKLCNDLSDGLPAEIEARKKQYEYYRDKLLTF